MEELHLLKTPCILHWDLNHFVVLKSSPQWHPYSRSGCGARRMAAAEVSRHFTGVALELTPTGGFEAAEASAAGAGCACSGAPRGSGGSFFELLSLALAIELFAMISPLFMQWVVDQALVTADRDLLLTLVLGFSLLLLIQTTVSAMRGWMLMVFSASLRVQARTNLFSHLINLPASYFEARHQGDVMSRFPRRKPSCRPLRPNWWRPCSTD